MTAPTAGPVTDRRQLARDHGISARQLDVLDGLSRGLTSAQIGRELFLTHASVKTHRAALLRNLKATSGPHAVAIGFRLGLLR